MPKKRYFLDKFVKIPSKLGALPPDPFGFRRLGIRSRLVFVTSLYYYNFCLLLMSKKNKLLLFFYSNSALFQSWIKAIRDRPQK